MQIVIYGLVLFLPAVIVFSGIGIFQKMCARRHRLNSRLEFTRLLQLIS